MVEWYLYYSTYPTVNYFLFVQIHKSIVYRIIILLLAEELELLLLPRRQKPR